MGWLRQVVDRYAAPAGRGEVAFHPTGDLASGRGAGRVARSARTRATARDEVVDLAVAHQGLELSEGRRRVGPVEAPDGHHGLSRRQLVGRGLLSPDGRDHPGVSIAV